MQMDKTLNTGIHLSACMIVKNETEMLPGCLESIRNHVDEIVIVDTGSTDTTVELAERYGARIFYHQWEHDFSAHRNQSISYARGQWILIIDADEVFLPSPARTLKSETAIAEEEKIDSLVMKVENIMYRGKETVCNDSIRLFRNNGAIHYEGIVHNSLTGFVKAGASLGRIIHYGYDRTRKTAGQKFERTATLLRKQIAQNPDNAAAHMYLSCSYASLDMHDESLEEGIKAIELIELQNIENRTYTRAFYGVIRTLILLKRYEEAENVCKKAKNRFGDQVDILAAWTMISFEKKKWEMVLFFGKKYLEHLESYKNRTGRAELVHVATYGDAWKIYGWMGSAELNLGNIDKADTFYCRALDCTADKEPVYRHGGLAFARAGHLEKAHQYLEKSQSLSKNRTDTRVVEALFKIGILKKDIELTGRSCSEILSVTNPSIEWFNELADFALRYGDTKSAFILYSAILEMDFGNLAARLRSAMILLEEGRIEEVVRHCDKILRILSLPRNIKVTSFGDMGELFARIEHELNRKNIPDGSLAHRISVTFAELDKKAQQA